MDTIVDRNTKYSSSVFLQLYLIICIHGTLAQTSQSITVANDTNNLRQIQLQDQQISNSSLAFNYSAQYTDISHKSTSKSSQQSDNTDLSRLIFPELSSRSCKKHLQHSLNISNRIDDVQKTNTGVSSQVSRIIPVSIPEVVSIISNSLENGRPSLWTAYLVNPWVGRADQGGSNKISHHSSNRYHRPKRTALAEMTIRDPVGKLGYMARLTRTNSSLKESKIAAIFRGVAYGMPEENPPIESRPSDIPEVSGKKPSFDVGDGVAGDFSEITRRKQVNHDGTEQAKKRIPVSNNNSSADETKIEHIDGENLPNFVIDDRLYKDTKIISEDNDQSIVEIPDRGVNNNFVTTNIRITAKPSVTITTITNISDLDEKLTRQNIKKYSNISKPTNFLDFEIINDTLFSNWTKTKTILGVAWPIHVHTVTCVNGILSVISLYELSRGRVWHNISPVLFTLFYVNVIASTALRSVSYFLDAFGAEHRLPIYVVTLLWNLYSPILLSMLVIFLLVLLKTFSYSQSMFHPTIAAIACTFHLLLCIGMELSPQIFNVKWLRAEAHLFFQLFTAAWGFIVSIAYTVLLSKIERQKTVDRKGTDFSIQSPLRLKRAARFAIVASSSHIVLSAIIIVSIVMPNQPPRSVLSFNIWFWFTHQCIARFFEVLLCVCLLVASCALVHYKQGDCPPTQKSNLCSLFAKCCTNRAAGVHPATKRNQQLAVFTLHNAPSSYDYATNDFQLVWNKSRPNEYCREDIRDQQKNEVLASFRTQNRNFKPIKFLPTGATNNELVFTPSPDEMYNSPLSKSTTGLYDNIQIEQISKTNNPKLLPYSKCSGFYVNNYKYIGATLPNRPSVGNKKTFNAEAQCRGNSSASGFMSPYWSPQRNFPSLRQNNSINDEGSGSGNCHSVDYLSSVRNYNKGVIDRDTCDVGVEFPLFNFPTAQQTNESSRKSTHSPSLANTLCNGRRNELQKNMKQLSSTSTREMLDFPERLNPVHTLPVRLSSSPKRKKIIGQVEKLLESKRGMN